MANSQAGDYRAQIELNRYVSDLTPALAMAPEKEAISVLKRQSEQMYIKAISLLLVRTCELVNASNTMTDNQIIDLAYRIAKKYYFLRMDELLYVLQRGTEGAYGKDYNRIDAMTVIGWLDLYDVNERTPIVTDVATQKVDESARIMTDEQLSAYYGRVAAGVVTEQEPASVRLSERFEKSDKQKQTEARERYIREKQQGIVEDYTNFDDLPNE